MIKAQWRYKDGIDTILVFNDQNTIVRSVNLQETESQVVLHDMLVHASVFEGYTAACIESNPQGKYDLGTPSEYGKLVIERYASGETHIPNADLLAQRMGVLLR